MKIDLSKKLKDTEGTLLEGISAGRALAEHMMNSSTTQALRSFKLAMALMDDKEIDIAEDDVKFLKNIADGMSIPNKYKAQVILLMEEKEGE